MKKCRHCGRKVNRPKGLCWSCYYNPEISARYPSTSIYARRGVSDKHREGLPCEPAPVYPGTSEKIALMEQRAAEGKQLFHELDGRC